MENKDSKETGRLTPELIDAVMRQSEKIRKIDEIFERSLNNQHRQVVHFCIDLHTIAVMSEFRYMSTLLEDGIFDDCIIVDDGFFEMSRNYFRVKRQFHASRIEKIIFGEGGAQ